MNKCILITGAASGIGKYIAEQYIKKKYKIICIDKNEISDNQNIEFYKCDLLNENETQKVFNQIEKIDFAINCAGVSSTRKQLIEFSTQDIITGWSDNFISTFNALKNEIKIMINNGGGRIVNIASITGKIGMKNFLAYGTAKASIINMSKIAAIEYAKDNIKVNSISPASIDTPMIRKKLGGNLKDYSQIYYTHNCGSVHDVYSVVSMLEENNFITGSDIILDGGLTTLFQI